MISPHHQIPKLFKLEQLRKVIKHLKLHKAVGQDEVLPDLLRHMIPSVQFELLTIISHCWHSEWCPQSWYMATIILFLKNVKDPADVGSYRSKALMSMVIRRLGHIIARLLSWQLLKSSRSSIPGRLAFVRTAAQTVNTSSCYNSLHIGSSRLSTFFDFSWTYDGVWQAVLLLTMTRLWVAICFVEWLSTWITKRTSCLRMKNSTHGSRGLKNTSHIVLFSPQYCFQSASTVCCTSLKTPH